MIVCCYDCLLFVVGHNNSRNNSGHHCLFLYDECYSVLTCVVHADSVVVYSHVSLFSLLLSLLLWPYVLLLLLLSLLVLLLLLLFSTRGLSC